MINKIIKYCKCGCGSIDEPLHYDKNGNLKNKDIIRQNEIKEKLKCKFFRYNENKNYLYEI